MAQVNDGTAGEPIKKLASDGKAAAAAAPPPSFARQLSFWPAIAILLPVMVALTWVSCYMHYTLPQPRAELYLPTSSSSSNGSSSPGLQAVFSEHEAMRYIHALATHEDGSPRYRIVGTEEMVLTEQYLLREIERIRDQVVEKMPLGLHQIEIWHQRGSGEHLFHFQGKPTWKKYADITNIIVRLSDGTAASKANAVLVNAHTDSTLPSPGAADDLIGVGTMLEALRVMAMTERRLTNSVVFLFNSAEESLQDASHLFITQHPLKDSIRAVINLEACGVGGPEIVFQATSDEMIRALAKTPRPYATVLANEIFSTGIILSDTDFRQFAEYGNLTGLDMALVQGSYAYHTRLDVPENIEPGALQHMGQNTLALLEYLTSPDTQMGNSPTATNLPKSSDDGSGGMIFFSGLGGKLFFLYTRQRATFIYGQLATLAAVIVSDRADWTRKSLYVAATLGVSGTFLATLVGANLAAAVLSLVMGKTMVWFRRESFPVLLFAPPAAISALLFQRTLMNKFRTPRATRVVQQAESAMIEHATLLGQLIHYTTLLLLGHSFGIRSSYLFAIGLVALLSAIGINDYVLCRGGEQRRVHLAAYIILQIAPLLLGIEGLIGFLDLFVPLTGRLGADAPVDFIIASLTAGVGFLCTPMILPFCHRFGPKTTARMALFLTFVTAGTFGWFTRPASTPYDKMHPKRLLVLHMENITTVPEFHLHVASVDGAPFGDLVLQATDGLRALDSVPTPLRADDHSSDWDIIFPVSQFLTTYKIALPPTAQGYMSPFRDTFQVRATRSTLNSVTKTRAMEIEMLHPGLIWPVIAFDADVVSWDLPKAPERGNVRHHVKSVAGYGVTRFTLQLIIQLTDDQFSASMRESQRDKGQRGDSSASDRQLGRVRVDYSGLDEKGMWPSSRRYQGLRDKPGMRFFERFEQRLPEEVDAMLLSAVAGVAHL